MTESERIDFINGLRAFATFLKKHPGIAVPTYVCMNAYVSTRDEIVSHAKLTTWTKHYYGSTFVLGKRFGPISFEVNVSREQICQKVVTGTRVIPAMPATAERVEDTYEWVCDEPLLGK